ncbi:MAG: leucine-rich repeat domain-containing protein [Firmicutes bacterium]|nr:leucine-rich repeat domain-containing protein [Bacillota bacterium]
MKKIKKLTVLLIIALSTLLFAITACERINEGGDGMGNEGEVKDGTTTYTVRFNSNGGSAIAPITQEEGTQIAKPSEPTKANSFFNGWYYNSALTNGVNFPFVLDKNYTLFASWITHDIAANVAKIDFNSLDFGDIVPIGINLLPLSERENYEIVIDTPDFLEYTDYQLKVVGIGYGELKIKDLAKDIYLYSGDYQIMLTPLTIEIKQQLIRQNEMIDDDVKIPKNLIKEVSSLNIERRLNEMPELATGIGQLTGLTELNLSNNNLSDISFVSNLTNLKSLNVYRNNITDISAVNRLPLQTFIFDNNQVSNIMPLNSVPLRELRVLSMRNNKIPSTGLSGAVNNLTGLRELYIGGNDITAINAIANLTNIRKLDLSYTLLNLNNVISLNYFKQLEMLNLSGIDLDVTTLATDMTNLVDLRLADCSGTSIMNVAHLLKYPKLEYLDISGNNLDHVEFDIIVRGASALTGLKGLAIGKNKFVGLPDLGQMISLETLDLSNSKSLLDIEDIRTLPNSGVNLKELYLDNCSSLYGGEAFVDQMAMFRSVITELTGLEVLSLVDGFQYLDRMTFDYLTDKVNNSLSSFRMRVFEDEWVEKDRVVNLRSAFFFSLSELTNNTNASTVSENSIRFKFYGGNRKIVLNLIPDLQGITTKSINTKFIIPQDIFEVCFVGYYSKTFTNMSIEVEDRKESRLTISLYNMNFIAPSETTAIYSPFDNPIYIRSLGRENSIAGGNGTNGLSSSVSRQNGGNASNGGTGVFCANYFVLAANAPIIIRGGNGGNGGQGGPGGGGLQFGNSSFMRGGTGGNGGFAIISTDNVTINGFGIDVLIQAGNGGNGGDGRNGAYGQLAASGGHGGNGGVGISASGIVTLTLTQVIGGNGGNGMNGGNGHSDQTSIGHHDGNAAHGGNGGNGGNALVAKVFTGTNGQNGIVLTGGASGSRGTGGNGGIYNWFGARGSSGSIGNAGIPGAVFSVA